MSDVRSGVLAVGSIIVDFGKVIDRWPEPEQLATIADVSTSTGGPALNMAIDLSRLGAPWPVALAGAIGDDPHGAFVRAECAAHGIDTSAVRVVPGAGTSFTDAMVEAGNGRRTFFHHAGANALFDEAWVDVEASTARILHVGAPGIHSVLDGPGPGAAAGSRNGWVRLLSRARSAGLQTNMELVSLESARLAELVPPCLPLLDTIVVNELEAGAVVGLEATATTLDRPIDWTQLERIARALVTLGVSRLAVVHFPAGCVAAAPGGRVWRQGSVRVAHDEVRSTTGAGDAFAAGVLLGLHDELPVEQCLRNGVAAAAASIRSDHTSAGVGPLPGCLARAHRDGFRTVGP